MLLTIAAILLLAAPDDAQIVTADGATLAAREITLARSGAELVATVVDASGQTRTFKAADLVEISFGARPVPPARPGPDEVEVRLTTGDVLLGRLGARNEEGVALLNPVWGDPLVKFGQVRSVVALANRVFLPRQLPAKVDDADVIFTVTGDRAQGTLLALSNAGVAYKSLALDREVVQPLKDVAGVFLIETEAPPKEPSSLLASVQTSDGSSIRGDLESIKDGILVIKDLYGQERKITRSALSSLHFKNGRVVYLSDVAPKAVDENSTLIRNVDPKARSGDLSYPVQLDRSAKGGKLVLGGVEHRKGLGVRAHSSLTWALDGGFRRFQAVAGLDAAAVHLGFVTMQVWIDGRKAAEHTFKGAGALQALDLDVAGAKELRLVATWPEGTHGQSDFADWGSARLIR